MCDTTFNVRRAGVLPRDSPSTNTATPGGLVCTASVPVDGGGGLRNERDATPAPPATAAAATTIAAIRAHFFGNWRLVLGLDTFCSFAGGGCGAKKSSSRVCGNCMSARSSASISGSGGGAPPLADEGDGEGVVAATGGGATGVGGGGATGANDAGGRVTGGGNGSTRGGADATGGAGGGATGVTGA